MKNPLIIFAAFCLAAAVSVVTYYSQISSEEKTKILKVETITILVAKNGQKQGDRLDLKNFEWAEWPKTAYTKQYYAKSHKKDLDALVGGVIRSPIQPGEPLKKEDLFIVGDKSALSALVRPEMRAVTVPLTKIVNPSNLYVPGDVVDIVIPKKNQNSDAEPSGETLIAGVRIIAVDMEFQAVNRNLKKEEKEAVKDPKTITIEVTAKQAEELAGAIPTGNIVVSQHSSFGPQQETPQSRVIETSVERRNVVVLRGGQKDNQP